MRTIDVGASKRAIKAHYDVGDEFFALWLDKSMTYSCALWDGESDSLESAQLRKLNYHIAEACISAGNTVLDVGCGWGSLLQRLVAHPGVRTAVGLTLSDAQAAFVRRKNLPGVDVRLEHWKDHEPQEPYDAIVSIGALEHFVRPEAKSEERIAEYRAFFRRCAEWLRRDGMLSLQTIAYGRGRFTHGAISAIFPESDLPRLEELATAWIDDFDLVKIGNDRLDYARTCRCWIERLRANRVTAERLVGRETVRHYEAFLDAAARGFDLGVFLLLRMQLRRYPSKASGK
jgi:cyclopropane-fatty-acyl-phospholipid synthase